MLEIRKSRGGSQEGKSVLLNAKDEGTFELERPTGAKHNDAMKGEVNCEEDATYFDLEYLDW